MMRWRDFCNNFVREKAKYLPLGVAVYFVILFASLSMVQIVLRYSTEDFGTVSLYYDIGTTKSVFDQTVVIQRKIIDTGEGDDAVYFQVPFWKVNDLQITLEGIRDIQIQEFRVASIFGTDIDLKQMVDGEQFTYSGGSVKTGTNLKIAAKENNVIITGINLKIFLGLLISVCVRSLIVAFLVWGLFVIILCRCLKKGKAPAAVCMKLLGSLCIILMACFMVKMVNQKNIEESAVIPTDNCEEDTKNDHYTIEFVAEKPNLIAVLVDDVSYSEVGKSAKYKITDAITGEVIIESKVKAAEIIYQGGMKIDVSECAFQRGREYIVDIYLADWKNVQFNQYEEGKLYGRVLYRFNSHMVGYVVVLALALVSVVFLWKIGHFFSVNKVILVSVFLGILFVFIIPPFSASDEIRHLSRAYTLTQNNENIISKSKKYVGSGGGAALNSAIFPKQLSDLRLVDDGDDYDDQSYLAERSNKVNWSKLKNVIFKDYGDEVEYISMWGVESINFLCYLPQMAFIFIWNFFGLPAWGILYAARFGNLCLALILCWLSVYIMPVRYRDIAVAACFIPNIMLSRSTCSLDGIVAAVCLLFVAYVMKLWEEETDIWLKQAFTLGALLLAIALLKLPYVVILFMVLILKNENFRTGRKLAKRIFTHTWMTGICVAIGVLMFGFVWHYTRGIFMRGGSSLLSGDHVEYIIQYPQKIAVLIWNFVVCETIPYLFQGVTINSNLLLSLSESVCLLLCFVKSQQTVLRRRSRAVLWGTTFLMILALFMVGYSLMTPGTLQLTEISGRYYIPIIPIALLAGGCIKPGIYKLRSCLEDLILSVSFMSLLYCFYIYWI